MRSHSHTFSIPFAKAKRSAISYYLLFSDIHNFRGYSFLIEYTTVICCAFPEMSLLECIKHSYHLAVPNVNPFECIRRYQSWILAALFSLRVWNVITYEGVKWYHLWMHQMLSLFDYLQCSSMCSPYVTICFYLICIVYPNLFNYSYVHIVCSQTDSVDKWQDQGCVIIDLTDLSMRSGTGVKLTEEWDKSEVGKVFWVCIVYLERKVYFCVYVTGCDVIEYYWWKEKKNLFCGFHEAVKFSEYCLRCVCNVQRCILICSEWVSFSCFMLRYSVVLYLLYSCASTIPKIT